MINDTKRMFVELDALFDTRQGTLGVMNPRATLNLIIKEEYSYRSMDHFAGFDMDEYRRLYEKRDKKVLQASTVTPVLKLIHEHAHRVKNATLNSPMEFDCEIVINMHPYQLTDAEQALIREAILSKIPLSPEINFVSLTLEQLNPYYISRNFCAVVLYHFNEWLNAHIENKDFQKYPCFHVTMFAPAIVKDLSGIKPGTDLAQNFIDLLVWIQPMIGLMYLPVENFCSILAYRKSIPSTPQGAEDIEEEKEPIPDFSAMAASRRT